MSRFLPHRHLAYFGLYAFYLDEHSTLLKHPTPRERPPDKPHTRPRWRMALQDWLMEAVRSATVDKVHHRVGALQTAKGEFQGWAFAQ